MNPKPYGEAIDAAKADAACNALGAFYLTRVTDEKETALFNYVPILKEKIQEVPQEARAVYTTFYCNDWRQIR